METFNDLPQQTRATVYTFMHKRADSWVAKKDYRAGANAPCDRFKYNCDRITQELQIFARSEQYADGFVLRNASPNYAVSEYIVASKYHATNSSIDSAKQDLEKLIQKDAEVEAEKQKLSGF